MFHGAQCPRSPSLLSQGIRTSCQNQHLLKRQSKGHKSLNKFMFDKNNNSTRDFIILVKVNLSFEF